jgi:hypothetical protein
MITPVKKSLWEKDYGKSGKIPIENGTHFRVRARPDQA